VFFLAIRYLLYRKRQTLLTLSGILLGTAGFIVISGFMLGFRLYILDQLVNNDAQVRISAREEFLTEHSLDRSLFRDAGYVFWSVPPAGRKDSDRIQDPQGWYRRLDADPRVVAYAPQLSTKVILTYSSAKIAATLIGCNPAMRAKVTNIERYMVNGRFADISGRGNHVVAGQALLDKLGSRVGAVIRVASPNGLLVPCKVAGSFKTGIQPIDETTVYGDLFDVQRIDQRPNEVNEIAVRIARPDQARAVAADWQATAVERVQSWDQINANFLSVFRIQDFVRYTMVAVILLVAGFGIYNVLNVLVTQKRREIAILRSMGYLPGEILSLFFIQGLLLGLAGGAFGLLIGYGVCLYLQTLPFPDGTIGGTGKFLVSFQPSIYVQGFFLALGASAVAGLLPARAASKFTPVEIIRSE
jgi:lipoprotein-releasing system permease protein